MRIKLRRSQEISKLQVKIKKLDLAPAPAHLEVKLNGNF